MIIVVKIPPLLLERCAPHLESRAMLILRRTSSNHDTLRAFLILICFQAGARRLELCLNPRSEQYTFFFSHRHLVPILLFMACQRLLSPADRDKQQVPGYQRHYYVLKDSIPWRKLFVIFKRIRLETECTETPTTM
jgi:hypothetical protein